jgi:hypothetical protein
MDFECKNTSNYIKETAFDWQHDKKIQAIVKAMHIK